MKTFIRPLIILFLLLLCSCSSQITHSNESTLSNSLQTPKEDTVAYLASLLQGRWVVKNSEFPIYFDFNSDDVISSRHGSSFDGRSGYITKANSYDNMIYHVTIFYPELVLFDGEEVFPELQEEMFIYSENDYTSSFICTFEDGSSFLYTRDTETNDEPLIPSIAITSNKLYTDFSIVKARLGYNLLSGWKETAQKIFFLNNLENTDFYLNTLSKHEYIGISENKVIIHAENGFNGTKLRVKDFLPDDALSVPPAIYPLDEIYTAFLWKINNGYLIIYVMHMSPNINFYDQRVINIAHVSDLKYLSFVEPINITSSAFPEDSSTQPQLNPEAIQALTDCREYYHGTYDELCYVDTVEFSDGEYYHYVYDEGIGMDFYVKSTAPYSVYCNDTLVWENGNVGQ